MGKKYKPQGCFRAGVPRPWRWKGGKAAARKRYRLKNREKILARKRKHYREHRDQERQRQLKYRKANQTRIYSYNKEWIKEYRAKIKAEVFAAYGGRCACCGESEPLFLELDHIHNDGSVERKKHGNQFVEWVALRRAGFPKGRHQILCSNCNQGKRRNGGVCPHVKNQS